LNKRQFFTNVVGGFLYLLPRSIKNRLERAVFMHDDDKLPPDDPCDVGIVFGGEGRGRAAKALEGYEEGVFDKILCVGGVGVLNHDSGEPEAKEIHDFLVAEGVPDYVILIETRSKNTVENAEYSLELMEEVGIVPREYRICVVTSDFHLRRCVGILGTAIGSYKNVYWMSSKEDVASRARWRKTPEGCFFVAKEAFRLWQFRLLGKIREPKKFKQR